ncbi:MAG: antibiotic biosynthesis monooxygenase [Chloroflexi bacterium]|nr:antibiotic biosynthesis monooxygenase [Chloroflexota bacterium]
MVILVTRVTVHPDRRDECLDFCQRWLEDTRHSPGCLSYRLYEESGRTDDLLFLGEWKSMADLDRHFRTPHFATLVQRLPGFLSAPSDVKIHDIFETRTILGN